HGARVISCPLLEERAVENRADLEAFIERLASGQLDTMIFFTGVGVRLLAEAAEAAGRLDDFLAGLGGATVVARGPKPVAALRKLGRTPDLVPDQATSEGLLALLAGRALDGQRVGVQLYGTPNPEFVAGLERMGAHVAAV